MLSFIESGEMRVEGMMRKFVIGAAVALGALFGGGTASAGLLDFVGIYAGWTQEPDLQAGTCCFEMDHGLNVGGVFGWNLSPEISVGADFMYTNSGYHGFHDTDLETFSFMAAGYFNFDIGSDLRPFIGAGLGGVQVSFSSPNPASNGSDIVFGYEGMAGVTYALQDNLGLALAYKYQAANDATIQGFTDEYKSHNLSLAIVFGLN